MAMREVPEEWQPRLADLTVPGSWALARWLFQDGTCYAAVLMEEGETTDPLDPASIQAWAVLTFEDGEYPVLGCYTTKYRRGRGYGSILCQHLLLLHSAEIQDTGGVVCAVASLWPKYTRMIERAGFQHQEWE